jgi:UDP-N-acetylglucosamine acyltransferase
MAFDFRPMPRSIHPTAIIDPAAQIGDDVVIGPYCIIGPDVTLGEGCWLQHHVTLCGPSVIGKRNKFYAFTSIGQQTQDLKYQGEPTFLDIGDDNSFREFCTVNRGTLPETRTVIGHHNHFLAYCHIAHDCVVGNHVIFSNNGTLAGHVIVEDYVILGGLTAVHQFCRLGTHAITGGCAKVVQDIAPFTIADGNPARARGINVTGLKRHGFSDEDALELRRAYKTLYRSQLNITQALDALRESNSNSHVQKLVDFVAGSQRGIVKAGRGSD